ncbi:helix-turn-helix domain-containing protein [Kushneria aurantia]|uniref:Helix-turn-helix domain-containing protein n=1 Tax=Kushneria aurantia TaxID=504092 RepID=A0ABV6G1Q2_9GAMM|nr:helix-turn-helix transcriptional regulator [Kushneria aurantia]
MNVPTENLQIISGPDGAPAFVVIPYADYMAGQPESGFIPNEVVGMIVNDGLTLVAAWRKYLKLTQAEVAERIGISQSAYAQQEKSEAPRRDTLKKIALAFGISLEQLSED